MIDGGIFLGRNPTHGIALNATELSERASSARLPSHFILSSYQSIFFDHRAGNEGVLQAAESLPGKVIPAITVSPNGFELESGKAYLEQLRNRGAKVLGLYQSPKYYDLELESLHVREIARMAAELGYVLQIGLNSAKDLGRVVEHYSGLGAPVLVRWMSGRGYNNLGEILTAAKQAKNLYFDVGSIVNSGGIAQLIQSIGSSRLYLASGFPENILESSYFLLLASDVSEKDRAGILHGTLAKVLAVSDEFNAKSPFLTQLQERFERLARFPKIDTHYHVDGWNLIEPRKEPKHVLEDLKATHVEKAVISSIEALNYDMVSGNRRMAELSGAHSEIYALIVIDPLQPELTFEEIRRYSDHPKFVGLKSIQDLYDLSLDSSEYRKIFEFNQSLKNLPVMAHIPGMLAAAERFPKTHFICAHSTWGRVKSMLQAPNIFFDLATSHASAAETRLDILLEQAGSERLLFASDGQLIHPAWTLGKLASYDFPETTLERIFKLNALKAFPKLKARQSL